jgi:hypothetical protein
MGRLNPRQGKKRQESDETDISDGAAFEDDDRKPSASEVPFRIESDDYVFDNLLSTSATAVASATAAAAGSLVPPILPPQVNLSSWQQQHQEQMMESTKNAMMQLYFRHHRHDEHLLSQHQEQLGLGVTALYPKEQKLPPPSASLSRTPYPHPLESCLEPRTIEEMIQDPDSTCVSKKMKPNKNPKKPKQNPS